MKLQAASRKEIARIARGTLVCDGILIAGLFLLSLVGVGSFPVIPILVSTAVGTVVAIANFAILCLTVQSAVEIEDKKQMKARFQLSYNLRLVLQAGWVVACLAVPFLHFFAGAAPVLFPNAVIFYLQSKNKLVTPSEAGPAPEGAFDDEEEHLGSFEI